jgi:hypothetical protein
MKKFIIDIVIFFALIIVVAIPVDLAISAHKRSVTDDLRYSQWNDMLKGNVNADMIIMGASRARMHLDTEILDSMLGVNSYNLGMDGTWLNYQIKKYDVLCEYNVKPKVVVQCISYGSLKYDDDWYPVETIFPYFTNRVMWKHIIRESNHNYFQKFLPCYRYLNYARFARPMKGVIHKGYLPSDASWNDGGFAQRTDSVDFLYDERSTVIFEDHIRKLQQNGIKIILLYPPQHICLTKRIAGLDRMYKYYDSISAVYDIPIMDYHYDSIGFDTQYFCEPTHLNRMGAELFTRKFAHDLDSVLNSAGN